jgi:predicted Rossmann fold flavoprotein
MGQGELETGRGDVGDRGEGAAPASLPEAVAARAAADEGAAALVVGGGPAGLFAAARLAALLRAEAGPEAAPLGPVILLERGPRPGRKLLVSGSGRCNLAHACPVEEELPRFGGGGKQGAAGRFLKPALHALDTPALLSWFEARGIRFVTEESGKVFPASGRARDLLEVLLAELAAGGVRVLCGRRVTAIEREGSGFRLEASVIPEAEPGSPPPAASTESHRARLVLIATGGASWPVTGSSGDGYGLASSLGHAIVEPRPALSPVIVRDWELAGLSGISFTQAGLALRRGGKIVLHREGDLLITHEGLSGPLVLDAARDLRPGDELEMRFVPPPPAGEEGKALSPGEATAAFEAALERDIKESPRAFLRRLLAARGLPRALVERFLERAGLDFAATGAELPRAARRELARLATAFPLRVDALGDWKVAMATAGGVSLAEVDRSSMESRITPGLYLAGEVLDYDGDTGGYNLHAAFATGALAATAMAEVLRRVDGGEPRDPAAPAPARPGPPGGAP